MLSIEGRIRDLALAEVFQLLAQGRKTGVLTCEAPLLSRRGCVVFSSGAIVDADVYTLGFAAPVSAVPDRSRGVAEAVLDVLCWPDGTFHFAPGEPRESPVRLAVEPLLIEAAQRAVVWDDIEAQVPHARVVPAFRDLEAGELPELRLTSPQWEVLTYVDGERDLLAIASLMRRELTDIAVQIHGLIEVGLLTLREAPVAPRRNPTPPTNAALPLEVLSGAHDAGSRDLWVPDPFSAAAIRMPGETAVHDLAPEALFDPVKVGVLTPDGLPALPVAPPPVGPSFAREQGVAFPSETHMPTSGAALCQQGDSLLRGGDLVGAIAAWDAALRSPVPVDEAERLREVLALASRLHALVPR